jgi:hypothetical protein
MLEWDEDIIIRDVLTPLKQKMKDMAECHNKQFIERCTITDMISLINDSIQELKEFKEKRIMFE